MTIPKFFDLTGPTLKALADGKPHDKHVVRDRIAEQFALSKEEQELRIPSGPLRWANRFDWALTHLRFALLIERPAKGVVQITARGKELLATKPAKIDQKVLRQYAEYLESTTAKDGEESDEAGPASKGPSQPELDAGDPEQSLIGAVDAIESKLATELLDRLKRMSPSRFEHVVLELMGRLGYGGFVGAAKHNGKSGDAGVDGLIHEDRLGLDVIYVQAKRWEGTVGSPVVREFLGALDQGGAKKGVLITTGRFSKDAAAAYSRSDKKISLIDGTTLARLLIERDLGVTTFKTFAIKRLDSDFFAEDE